MKTTLNQIRSHRPCKSGWEKLLKHLGKTQADDQELSLLTILKSNGLEDTLWCMRAVEGFEREKRLYAIWCASQVKHSMGPESLKALKVITKFAKGKATAGELAEAWARVSDEAWTAARDEVWAITKAEDAASYAAVARAANAVAEATQAGSYAAWAVVWTVKAANPHAQVQELKRVLERVEADKDPYPDE